MKRYKLRYKLRCNRDDELKHWKYEKKEKVNGKWRYYYPDVNKDKVYVDQPSGKVYQRVGNTGKYGFQNLGSQNRQYNNWVGFDRKHNEQTRIGANESQQAYKNRNSVDKLYIRESNDLFSKRESFKTNISTTDGQHVTSLTYVQVGKLEQMSDSVRKSAQSFVNKTITELNRNSTISSLKKKVGGFVDNARKWLLGR